MEQKLARRSGGRSRKSSRQTEKSIDQLDWSIPYNTDNFIEPLNVDGIEAIDIPDDSDYQSAYGFKDLMTSTIENILHCWK